MTKKDNGLYQMKRSFFGKKYKLITAYLFNDLFVWASARGKFKGSYSFYDLNLEIDIPPNSKVGDATFCIGLKTEKHKRLIQCADDNQRDNLLEKIKSAHEKCQKRIKNLSESEAKLMQQKSQRETQLVSELSQSSLGDSSGNGSSGGGSGPASSREHSLSSQSDGDFGAKQTFFGGPLGQISEHCDDEAKQSNGASNNGHNHSKGKSHRDPNSVGNSPLGSPTSMSGTRPYNNNKNTTSSKNKTVVETTTSVPLKSGGPTMVSNGGMRSIYISNNNNNNNNHILVNDQGSESTNSQTTTPTVDDLMMAAGTNLKTRVATK